MSTPNTVPAELMTQLQEAATLAAKGIRDPEATRKALNALPGAKLTDSGDRLVVALGQSQAPAALAAASQTGARILSLAPARRSLEEIFLQIAGRGTL